MEQIQSVLWCAMAKVSSSYSIKEFEEDLKANLTKCVMQIKSENRRKNEIEEEEKLAIAEDEES